MHTVFHLRNVRLTMIYKASTVVQLKSSMRRAVSSKACVPGVQLDLSPIDCSKADRLQSSSTSSNAGMAATATGFFIKSCAPPVTSLIVAFG